MVNCERQQLAALLREAACRADMEMDGDDAAYVVSRINRVMGELERAEPVAVDADERSLPDLGNELHNLSCTINHTREDWAEQIEGIAIELWNWKERTPPAPQVPSFKAAMGQMMAAATREGHKVKVDVKYGLLQAAPQPGEVE